MFSYLLNLFNNPPKHSSDSLSQADELDLRFPGSIIKAARNSGGWDEFDGVQHEKRSKR